MSNAFVRNKLGCALAAEFSVAGAEQKFQYGTAIWRGDQAKVTALYNNGTWAMLADPLPVCSCYGPLVPYLGWPSSARWSFLVSVQNFANGRMLWTPSGGIYVLFNDGTWRHFD
jgi:hypothetical protein